MKTELKAVQVKSDATSNFQDCVWISIGDVAEKLLLIGNIYRSGSPEKAERLDDAMTRVKRQNYFRNPKRKPSVNREKPPKSLYQQ